MSITPCFHCSPKKTSSTTFCWSCSSTLLECHQASLLWSNLVMMCSPSALVCVLLCQSSVLAGWNPAPGLLMRAGSTPIEEHSLMWSGWPQEVLSSIPTRAKGFGISSWGLLQENRAVTKSFIYMIMGISKHHPTWIDLISDECGSWWASCWYFHLAAGFQHPK